MVNGRNIQLKKEFKNAERTFLRFSSRIDMATTCSVVIWSFVIISPKPHLRLARLNLRSTSTRSQISVYSSFRSTTASFLGLPSAGPERRIPRSLQ